MDEENLKSHRALLKIKFDPIATEDLSVSEKKILSRYGVWMRALANGKILPYTKEQEHFVMAVTHKTDPTTEYEKAWIKYQKIIDKKKVYLEEKILTNQLSYEQLNHIIGCVGSFDFSKEVIDSIYIQLDEKKPYDRAGSFIVYSTTDGQ